MISVSGSARPGELLALMGSSGAGKTTLLNSLTFRSDHNVIESGVRSINGIPVNSKLLTAVSAYVQQHDLFIGTLTVREHLIFQVRITRNVGFKHNVHGYNSRRTSVSVAPLDNIKYMDTYSLTGMIK